MEFEDCFVDAVLLFDVIHGNDLQTKMPIRFELFEEAYRVLKPNLKIWKLVQFGTTYVKRYCMTEKTRRK